MVSIFVSLGNRYVDAEVDEAQYWKQPVEEIQMVPIDVVSDQPASVARNSLRGTVHNLHNYGAQEVSQSHWTPKEASGNRFKGFRRLGVEEFQKPYIRKQICDSEYEELKR